MPGWLSALTLGEILTWLTAIGAIIAVLRKISPAITAVMSFIQDWNGVEDRPGVPGRPGVLEQIQTLSDQQAQLATSVAAVRKQVENSHVTNLRDDMDGIRDAIRASTEDRQQLHKAVDEIREIVKPKEQ